MRPTSLHWHASSKQCAQGKSARGYCSSDPVLAYSCHDLPNGTARKSVLAHQPQSRLATVRGPAGESQTVRHFARNHEQLTTSRHCGANPPWGTTSLWRVSERGRALPRYSPSTAVNPGRVMGGASTAHLDKTITRTPAQNSGINGRSTATSWSPGTEIPP